MDRSPINAILREDLGVFNAKVFKTISPGRDYIRGWHLDAIAHRLRQVHDGEVRRLIITQPPRSLKSTCTSVGFVAWCLGHNPAMRFTCISYSHELAALFSRQFKTVVTSSWYMKTFPQMRLRKSTELEHETTKGGGRLASSVNGSITGRGGDIVIIDDPLKADDAYSEAARREVKDWFKNTLITRLDESKNGAILLVMQRLHEDDLAGMLISEGGWQHLNLPAIALEDEQIEIGPEGVHMRVKGDVLHAEREPMDILMERKRDMGAARFSAQYLQRPVPAEGNLIQREWLTSYEVAPESGPSVQIVQSWDPATTTSSSSAWSVCTTWAMADTKYYLVDVWRGRLEFPDLRRKVIALANRFQPTTVLIENAGPGGPLVQEFRSSSIPGMPAVTAIQPEGHKLMRMEAQCVHIESGKVLFPTTAEWLDELEHELLSFPYGRHDDQVDSISQFLGWATTRLPRRTEFFAPITIHGD